MIIRKLLFILSLSFFLFPLLAQHSIAREWNEEVLEAIRNDFARPTVHARNLFHTSLAMYDIWAVVHNDGDPYLLGDTIGTFISNFPGINLSIDNSAKDDYIAEAISYALYDIMMYRFRGAPKLAIIKDNLNRLMSEKEYDPNIVSNPFPGDQSAAAFGRYVAQEILAFGRQDGSNEIFDYGNNYYYPFNDPMLVTDTGNVNMNDPNRWQPLGFDVFIDQSGNPVVGNVPSFLGPEWGSVTPFSLTEDDLTRFPSKFVDGMFTDVYHDPGPPPYLSESGIDQESEDFRWGFTLVAIWSSMLDPTDGVMWDISPASLGNIEELPTQFSDYPEFYDLFNGGDISVGHTINPVTAQPYAPQIVPRGDYARVLAEFWADGPNSETPPGHWFTILHAVMDHPLFSRTWEGQGEEINELEYDVKAFFTLAGGMHDAAVATWGIKGWYDYVRPISVIRYMASKGQSSDPDAENYNVHGLPLIPGYIEIIKENDALASEDESLIGRIKIFGWRGPSAISNPETDVAGVGWTLAENWWPYQRPTFVSPPFAGYTSGHSCFSRAAAEILTMMTGDEFFPGGMGVFPAKKNDFLVFESGPSVDMELQWATYRDASDQTSLSRIWGGIHPPQDDIPGRIIGIDIGIEAFNKANSYFAEVNTSTYEETIVEDFYKIYPNPLLSTDRLQISKQLYQNNKEVKIEVYDIQARKVRSEMIRPTLTSLDLRGLRPGKYLMHIIDQDKRQISEFIIIE